MDADMAEGPRYTKFWRKQGEYMRGIVQASSDRAIALRIMRMAELRAAEEGIALQWLDKADEQSLSRIRQPTDTVENSLDVLVDLYFERAPSVVAGLDRELLRDCLRWRVEWELSYALGEDPMKLIPKRLRRLLPDNLLEIQPDGSVLFGEKARTEHWLQLRDYYRSLRPPGQRGRPKKEAAPRSSGWKPLDRDKALRAAQMKDDGADWPAIAKDLLPDFDPTNYNPRYRDTIRKRVSRLVEHGYLERGRPS